MVASASQAADAIMLERWGGHAVSAAHIVPVMTVVQHACHDCGWLGRHARLRTARDKREYEQKRKDEA